MSNYKDKKKNAKTVKIVTINASSKEDVLEKINKFIDENGIVPERTSVTLKSSKESEHDSICGCGRNPNDIIKVIPATKEEIIKNEKLFNRIQKLKEESKEIRIESEKWWAEIRLRIPDGFTHPNLHFNPDTGEIEYLKDDQDLD